MNATFAKDSHHKIGDSDEPDMKSYKDIVLFYKYKGNSSQDVEMAILNDPGIYWMGTSQTLYCPVPKHFIFTLLQVTTDVPPELLIVAEYNTIYSEKYEEPVSDIYFHRNRNPFPEKWHGKDVPDSIFEFTIDWPFTINSVTYELQAVITDLDTKKVYIAKKSAMTVRGITLIL